MNVKNWAVRSWRVDWDDGRLSDYPGDPTARLVAVHTYGTSSHYQLAVLATVNGDAEAAIYGPNGQPTLINRPFSLEIGNRTGIFASNPEVRYVPPKVRAGLLPSLSGSLPFNPGSGFQTMEVPRGRLTSFFLRIAVLEEGSKLVGTKRVGGARSTPISWRYAGASDDAPGDEGTRPGRALAPDQPIRLQWNSPDRLLSNGPVPYPLPVVITIVTTFSDGHRETYSIATTFQILVGFLAANS
jgi:hypothetical protein